MDGSSRSLGALRALVLGSATLAILGVLFAVYQAARGVPKVATPPPVVDAGVMPSGPTDVADGPTLELESGIRVGAGGGATIRWYDPETGSVRAEISHSGWKPIEELENVFQVTSPDILMRSPRGQLIRIQADQGVFHTESQFGERIEPRTIRLDGNVAIHVDRLSAQERAAQTDAQQAAADPDRFITITLEELDFDVPRGKVETAGPFEIASAEMDMRATGLRLVYDEITSTIVDLETMADGLVLVRGMDDLINLESPQTEIVAVSAATSVDPVDAGANDAGHSTTQTQQDESQNREDEAVASAATTRTDDLPMLPLPQASETKREESTTYRAVFDGDVRVLQTANGAQQGQLIASMLELVFDVGDREKSAAQRQTTSKPGDSAANAGKADANGSPTDTSTIENPIDAGASQLRVSWSGPLHVTRVEIQKRDAAGGADSDDGAPKPSRLEIRAEGEPVRLVQAGKGSVRCGKLFYDKARERVELYAPRGRRGDPVHVESEDGKSAEGTEIVFDLNEGLGSVIGPGLLTDSRSGMGAADAGLWGAGSRGGSEIRFADRADFVLGETELVDGEDDAVPTVDGANTNSTEVTAPKTQRYIQSAVFTGSVTIKQEDSSLAGEHVDVQFDKPTADTGNAMRRLKIDGGVRLVHGRESIDCKRMEVQMGLDESGRVSPRRAWCHESVTARQRSRVITASEMLYAELREFRRPKPPFELRRARAMARLKGHDPDTIDWEKQRAKYEAQDLFEPGLHRLEALGQVKVVDPERAFALRSDQLECTFVDGRTIEKAAIRTKDEGPSHVEIDDMSITGRDIYVNVAAETVDVPGSGRLTFSTQRDLDGRDLNKAVPVAIEWADRMSYRGPSNRATFVGDVKASSPGSVFESEELTVDFEDKPKPSAAVASKEPDWWILKPLMANLDKRSQRDDGDDVMGQRNVRKRPTHMMATGGAKALTTRVRPGTDQVISRGRIEGPRLLIDLEHEVMTIEGTGNLLIEDYETRQDPSSGGASVVRSPTGVASSNRSPFGGVSAGSPSQTFVTWQDQMLFYFGTRAAVFKDGVMVMHKSGSHVMLKPGVVGTVDRNALKKDESGRDASITCTQLAIQFRPQDSAYGQRSSGSSMSGNELDKFEATGNVLLQDSGIQVTSNSIQFDAERNELVVRGTESVPAEVYDQRGGGYGSYKGPLIIVNRKLNKIEAPNGTFMRR